jgi:hypothetical protein
MSDITIRTEVLVKLEPSEALLRIAEKVLDLESRESPESSTRAPYMEPEPEEDKCETGADQVRNSTENEQTQHEEVVDTVSINTKGEWVRAPGTMRLTVKEKHRSPGHTYLTIFVNGGCAGDICLRNEEVDEFISRTNPDEFYRIEGEA